MSKGYQELDRKCPPPRQDSKDGSHARRSEGSRMENPDTVGSEGYADHVDTRCNGRDTHTSEPGSLSSFVSVSDSRACDLHRLVRAVCTQGDHLADTCIF